MEHCTGYDGSSVVRKTSMVMVVAWTMWVWAAVVHLEAVVGVGASAARNLVLVM